MKRGEMELKMKNLADCPEHFGTVCRWLWKNWGKEEGLTLRDVEYRTRHSMFKDRVPMTFVAILGNKPVATASLWHNDLRTRPDIGPYLAELFVIPAMQRKGIGTKMQDFVISNARRIGLKSVYLITYHKDYYERNGWIFLGTSPFHHGLKKRVYQYKIDRRERTAPA